MNQFLFNKSFIFKDGVYQSLESESKFTAFELAYLNVRQKEKRVLSIEEIKQLPFVDKSSSDYHLWKIRRKNIDRILKYLSNKKQLSILDIGCGNGFFPNAMALQNHQICGLDVNLTELKQAAVAFPNKNIDWVMADIFENALSDAKFDLITFCTSFHYFKDADQTIRRCLSLLKNGGEIHIIDSPFYDEEKLEEAKNNTINYYHKMGVESMQSYFHHIAFSVFKNYQIKVMYQPRRWINKILHRTDSPFYWIKITV